MQAASQTALQLLDLAELRRTRALLRHEVSQATHWRRIIQARLDLTVARAVLPARLGLEITDQVSPEALSTIPAFGDLLGIARRPGDSFPVDDLLRLRAAERSLGEYEAHVRRALMAATDALVERLEAVRAVP